MQVVQHASWRCMQVPCVAVLVQVRPAKMMTWAAHLFAAQPQTIIRLRTLQLIYASLWYRMISLLKCLDQAVAQPDTRSALYQGLCCKRHR